MVPPSVKGFGFSCTCGARAIRGVNVSAAPVLACVICKVAVTAATVAARVGYHSIGARVIHGVSVTAVSAAARAGYHSCNSDIWSRHGPVGKSNHRVHGVNVRWFWVPCNE